MVAHNSWTVHQIFMNCNKLPFSYHHGIFFSSATSSPSFPWISPLQVPGSTSTTGPCPPPASSNILVESRRKSRSISHQDAIKLMDRERDPQRALDIFNMVANQKGFNHNNATFATILHKLARSNKFQAVDAILQQMTYETCKFHEGIFLNLMKHFSRSHMHKKVLDMFLLIYPIAREKPSLKAISTCLNCLVESNQIGLAKKLLLHSKKVLKLRPNSCIFNILIKHHCKNGDIESAFEVVREMKMSKCSYPNLITYSTLMDCLCKSGRVKDGLQLFEDMIAKDQIVPDALTYNVLINGFCQSGKVDGARKIMEFMRNNGCNPNVYNFATLMNGMCKQGMLQEAKEVIVEMKDLGMKLDAVGYTTLINSFCRSGRTDEALELIKEMKDIGCKADVVTFNVLLGGLCREGRFPEALQMLERLPYEGVHLNKVSYRIVLNSLYQKDELEKATELLLLMLDRGFLPHYETSNELLSSLCKKGMAFDSVKALFGLVELGFTPKPDLWSLLVEVICRERKLLVIFELLDKLTEQKGRMLPPTAEIDQ
ncbi:pentatricopeptide repeat-containing protein At5g18475 [Rhodamnia argentea]|uniref:Pentatricopeptide repeat-containing protein At5g18475 n=1 Tax=Rhodamnia argentea TaxID=178133 RepID=A0A8B8Q476_9MYRT|nr:pentatricopeptide repeat-containing protein At5g18475 [Rhodamnia argentea]XP_030541900.1 pentatricopeptide repeat-containing protein At5g18475 [Rhodamnia argentea]